MVDLQDSTPDSSTAPVSPAKEAVRMFRMVHISIVVQYITKDISGDLPETHFHDYAYGFSVRLHTIEPWFLIHDTIGVVILILKDIVIDLYLCVYYMRYVFTVVQQIYLDIKAAYLYIYCFVLSGHPPSEESPFAELLWPLGGNVATSLPCHNAMQDNTTIAMISVTTAYA